MPSILAVDLHNLGFAFDRDQPPAVVGVSLQIIRGEYFGLVGPDGAGKSTLLRLLAGILAPTEGRATLLGYDLRRESAAIKQRLAFLSQSFTLNGALTLDENIAFFANLRGVKEWQRRGDELLAFTRLTGFRKQQARTLPGGLREKLALACALIHTPELLLIEDPGTGMDLGSREEFWALLAGIHVQGVTLVITTPSLAEAGHCGRIGLMHKGTLTRIGTPEEIQGDAGVPATSPSTGRGAWS